MTATQLISLQKTGLCQSVANQLADKSREKEGADETDTEQKNQEHDREFTITGAYKAPQKAGNATACCCQIHDLSVKQTDVFEAAEYFARVEGILPAPESSHAIRVAIDEALKCKETGEEKTIVFGLTGTGYFDMVAYEKFHDGEMSDYIPTDEELENYRAKLPKID